MIENPLVRPRGVGVSGPVLHVALRKPEGHVECFGGGFGGLARLRSTSPTVWHLRGEAGGVRHGGGMEDEREDVI
eukprot:6808050-Pyramimonas_sp.AAC.1